MPKPPEQPKSSVSGLDLIILGILIASILPIIGGFVIYVLKPLDFLLKVKDFFAPFLMQYLLYFQLASIVFSAFFIWGIIYIFVRTNYFEARRQNYMDYFGGDLVFRRRSLIAVKRIGQYLSSEDQNDWKKAVFEADHVLNSILKMSGYLGSKLEDKLNFITSAQLSNIDEIKNVHKIRDKIAQDPSFEITKQEAKEIIGIYKQSFKELNLIQE